MSYLYDKVQKKVDEMMRKNRKSEIDMEVLKRNLPNKMRLTRYDVPSVMKELEQQGKFDIVGGKIKKRRRK